MKVGTSFNKFRESELFADNRCMLIVPVVCTYSVVSLIDTILNSASGLYYDRETHQIHRERMIGHHFQERVVMNLHHTVILRKAPRAGTVQ